MNQPVAPVVPLATERLAVHPLGITDVVVTDGRWARWQERNRDATTPHAVAWLERDGSVDNLRRAAAGAEGPHRGFWFSDSDVHKVLEALSWDLGRGPAPDISAAVAELSTVVGDAQRADGYVNSYVQGGHETRWGNMAIAHELYCIGHLIQAGVANRRATGSDTLLGIARRAADCVVAEFGDHRRDDTDGHPEIEMALVELYRVTGDRRYLDLAAQFVDVRGHRVLDPRGHFDSAYFQDATPVRAETTVVGHAVRALYLLAGVVDVYLETGDRELLDSAVRQWESLHATKMFLTGAVGSRFEGEAFGDEFELPPDLVYGETCATIANVMLSWRLLLATGESRYADSMERSLHNLFSASTSVRRTEFFYNNPEQRRVRRPAAPENGRPARADAPGTRPGWFACACCPPNIMRTVASLGAYVATRSAAGVQVHQYLPATIDAGPGRSLALRTRYPLDGTVEVTVDGDGTQWTLALRVPGWCTGATVTVDGRTTDAAPGYVELTRVWEAGDAVVLTLPMPVRLTVAHPAADALRGTVAIERGPVVYCLESPDQPDGVDLNHVELLVDRPLVEAERELLGGTVVVVTASGLARDDSAWAGRAFATLGSEPPTAGREVALTAVPYHLWANRGPSVMRVAVPASASTTLDQLDGSPVGAQ